MEIGQLSAMQAANQPLKEYLQFSNMPLAVYRELVAHLSQVVGIETGLLPQRSQSFDYYQSQVGGLWIQYAETVDAVDREQVKQILAYYSDRYGSWQPLDTEN